MHVRMCPLCCKQYVIDCRLDEVWRDYVFDLIAVTPLMLPPTQAQLRDCYRRLLTVFRQSAAKFVSCFDSVTVFTWWHRINLTILLSTKFT